MEASADVATYVVSTVDGSEDLVGVVREVESGRICHFEGPDGLLTALSGGSDSPDPGSGGDDPLDDGLGNERELWVEQSRRQERAITPSQLRITYLSAEHEGAA